MRPVMLFFLAVGAWLVASAVANRDPVTSALDIVRNPRSYRTVLDESRGKFVAPVAYSPGTASSTGAVPGGGDASGDGRNIGQMGRASDVIAFARAQIGKPYRWGATGPNAYDCSGLCYAAYKAAGKTIPRTTQLMLARPLTASWQRVERANLQPGDLVFPDIGHVGIYTSDGKMIDAPRTGSNVTERPVWAFYTARRVLG